MGTQLRPKKGDTAPNFRLMYILWPNGWMDEDGNFSRRLASAQATLCWMGTQLPLSKRGHSPHFLARIYYGQTAGWIKMALGVEVGLSPGYIVLDGDPAPIPNKGTESRNFRPISIVAKRLDASRCHLVWR